MRKILLAFFALLLAQPALAQKSRKSVALGPDPNLAMTPPVVRTSHTPSTNLDQQMPEFRVFIFESQSFAEKNQKAGSGRSPSQAKPSKKRNPSSVLAEK